MKKTAVERIRHHIARGDNRVCVVSASCEDWLAPWCGSLGIGLVLDEASGDDGKDDGKARRTQPPGTREGEENPWNILPFFRDFDEIYASMVDTSGDKEMLSIADHPHYRVFR
ncbi:MAG: hypothetical protein MZV70_16650 [Desulfobacterales bacterium]|nr:hypothetical protein [Desulfobacterales bacterium]